MRKWNKGEEKSSPGSPAWMTTYGDLMTLLLTFFVLLFSFSNIDAKKWEELVISFGGEPGIFDLNGNGSTNDSNTNEDSLEDVKSKKESYIDERFYKLYISISDYIDENEIPAEVNISDTHTEILLRFRDYILFDTGKADLKPEAKTILNEVSNTLNSFIDEIELIRVEGHTDNVPIHNKVYPTNWELSGGRAARVVRYFQEEHDFPGDKLSFAGYGEYAPIDSNNSYEGRANNRRVDILIVRKLNEIEYVE